MTAALIPTSAQLLRAILANPADDAPRLAYADWLEENGQPERAEFIRVQCELARTDTEKRGWSFIADGSSVDAEARAVRDENPHLERLRRRERELFRFSGRRQVQVGNGTAEVAKWWEHLPGSWRSIGDDMRIECAEGYVYTVRRGFVASIACTMSAFVGGACGTCRGMGDSASVHGLSARQYRRARRSGQCPTCHGSGRVPSIAGPLFACQPVTEVRLTDREPTREEGGWEWYGLPDELCAPETKGTYASRDLAFAALSRAAMNYGRQLAGLPPL